MTTSLYDGLLVQTVNASVAHVEYTCYRMTACICCEAGCGEYPRETLWAIQVDSPPLCPTCRGEQG